MGNDRQGFLERWSVTQEESPSDRFPRWIGSCPELLHYAACLPALPVERHLSPFPDREPH